MVVFFFQAKTSDEKSSQRIWRIRKVDFWSHFAPISVEQEFSIKIGKSLFYI